MFVVVKNGAMQTQAIKIGSTFSSGELHTDQAKGTGGTGAVPMMQIDAKMSDYEVMNSRSKLTVNYETTKGDSSTKLYTKKIAQRE